MRLKEIKEIRGKIVLETGLHIGTGDIEMHIGGTDNPVVKHPFTHEPYIPGSSLKGKVRSLLELKSGMVAFSKGKPLSYGDLDSAPNESVKELVRRIIKLFGTGGSDTKGRELGPTRASFSDCVLNHVSRQRAQAGEIVLTEVKAENFVNRITGTAENPRFTERVPAGVVFDFCISLKIFDEDEGDNLEDLLLEGLKLLEHDALGGSGSRGYGRIRFKFEDEGLKRRFKELNPFGN